MTPTEGTKTITKIDKADAVTKIDDDNGVRNEQPLIRRSRFVLSYWHLAVISKS